MHKNNDAKTCLRYLEQEICFEVIKCPKVQRYDLRSHDQQWPLNYMLPRKQNQLLPYCDTDNSVNIIHVTIFCKYINTKV
jgi:hypothetical protein